jgi:hypothetical protein
MLAPRKQKVRRIYGVLERRFAATSGSTTKGRTGEEMISSSSVSRHRPHGLRRDARGLAPDHQSTTTCSPTERLNIPRHRRTGDRVEIRGSSRKIPDLLASIASADKRPVVT